MDTKLGLADLMRGKISGPRAYIDFQLGRGFIAHLEWETMNSFVPSTAPIPTPAAANGLGGMMTGLKKEL